MFLLFIDNYDGNFITLFNFLSKTTENPQFSYNVAKISRFLSKSGGRKVIAKK